MSYKAILSYAWDLHEHGVREAVSGFAEMGLDTVSMAGTYHAGKFLRPQGRNGKVYFPEDGTAYVATNAELRAYLDFRCAQVTSLVAEIRDRVRRDADIAVIPTVARPSAGAWYEGSDLRALGETTGIIEACFYEPSADRIAADLFDLRQRLAPETKLRGILRPSFPDIESKGEFLAAIDLLVAGGVTDLAFYNWGHQRRRNLQWIGEALARVPK